jgi:signal peptidase I
MTGFSWFSDRTLRNLREVFTMILHLYKVTEQSLAPVFQEGDFVIILKIPFLFDHYKEGDVVVFNQITYGRMIKRVQAVSPAGDALFVIGSHPNSVDSREFGSIPIQSVLGKVVWHFRKKSRP